jgi:hypothetical protein
MRTWSIPAFIRMAAEDTFDGQERVFTRAAYDLQVRPPLTPRCGYPGYVPDDYLEHLDGLGIETTITAAELCAIGTWQRVGGGYRVLDWEAVEVCLDQVRQDKGEDPRALAWEREHEARIQARMAEPMVVTPPCAACGTPAAHIELLAPRPAARRVGTVARHRARQLPAPTRARTVVPTAAGHGYRHQLRRPHRRQPRRAHRLGAPVSPALRSGPHRQVPRRRRILPRL